jgi:hypothetical protein
LTYPHRNISTTVDFNFSLLALFYPYPLENAGRKDCFAKGGTQALLRHRELAALSTENPSSGDSSSSSYKHQEEGSEQDASDS